MQSLFKCGRSSQQLDDLHKLLKKVRKDAACRLNGIIAHMNQQRQPSLVENSVSVLVFIEEFYSAVRIPPLAKSMLRLLISNDRVITQPDNQRACYRLKRAGIFRPIKANKGGAYTITKRYRKALEFLKENEAAFHSV